MKSLFVIAAAGLFTAVSSGVVQAQFLQKPQAQRAPQKPELADEARRITVSFVACASGRGRKAIRVILAMPFDPKLMSRRLLPFMVSDCLKGGDGLRMPTLPLREAFYDHFYALDYGAAPVSDIDRVPAIYYPATPLGGANVAIEQYELMMSVGDCVVRKNTSDARSLILSKMTTAVEGDVIAGVARAIPACVPGHTSLRLSKVIIPAMIAKPLYRLSAASKLKTIDKI